jgi:hypothetical protein
VQKVFSAIDSSILLHVIMNTAAVSSERIDLSPSAEFLQLSVVPLNAGRGVKPHRALARPLGGHGQVQESWIVMRGAIDVSLYDTDGSFLRSATLPAGWLLVTFRGGHGFSTVDEHTTIIECKLGPYVGRDYEFI